jgi:hypothetical protein
MDKLKIIKKIKNIIKKYGIKKYIDKFDFKFDYNKDDDECIFYEKLNKFVKRYHNHSSLKIMKKLYNDSVIYENIKRYKNSKIWRKLPNCKIKNNIGIIEFYKFVMTGSGNFADPIDRKDRDKIVKCVNEFINNNKMKGLIIDFRKHYGGSFVPIALAFGKYFDTLFRFYQNQLSPWATFSEDKIVYTKYKSNKNYFPIPIAIIIGKNTSSSGEISAAIFYGKPNIKFFGEPTGGALSINEGHKINNNLELIITTALYQTTNKKIHYDEKLYPNNETNSPIKDAIDWILKQS